MVRANIRDRVHARSTIGRIAAFVAMFATLQALYGAASDTWVERLVIDVLTVEVAAALIDTIDPGSGVLPVGSRLTSPGGGINILNGCEGTDVAFLLTSAMLVAPLPFSRRVLGVFVGGAVVFVLNQARVIALFYALRHDRAWFDTLHGVVTPLLLIMAAGVFFACWLDRFGNASRSNLPTVA